MKSTIITIMVVVSLATVAVSADVVGGRAGAFLRTPVGVRAVGLGGSYVGVADDATSLYWNPAGLAHVEGTTIQIAHTSMGLDRMHSLLGVAKNLGDGNLTAGVLWDRFAVSDIQGRDQSGAVTSSFDDKENMLAGGLAVRLGRLALGGAVRYYQHGLADYTGDGMGYDVGARFDLELGDKSLALGASMCDLGASLTWDTPAGTEDVVPAVMRLGGALTLPLGTTSLMVAAGLHSIEDQDAYPSFGVEYALNAVLQLRTGLHDDRYAAGATVRVGDAAFSFALAEDVVEDSSYLTVGFDLVR